jgi:acyl-CoA thioesterase-1
LGLGLALLPWGMAQAADEADPVRLLALGDSLTAGYGLPPADAFPVRLEAALKAAGYDVTVLNAGVSGDTSAGGRARLDWVLAEDADAALVTLGANDALRGLDTEALKANLIAIVERLQAEGLPVLIAGMKAPPNLGDDYESAFEAVFPAVAEQTGALLYPFFLEGVAADPALNQADGIHPNAEGVKIVVKGILPKVEELLARLP